MLAKLWLKIELNWILHFLIMISETSSQSNLLLLIWKQESGVKTLDLLPELQLSILNWIAGRSGCVLLGLLSEFWKKQTSGSEASDSRRQKNALSWKTEDFSEVDLETISLRSLRNLPAMESEESGASKVSDFPESCPKERAFDLSEVSRKRRRKRSQKNAPLILQNLIWRPSHG